MFQARAVALRAVQQMRVRTGIITGRVADRYVVQSSDIDRRVHALLKESQGIHHLARALTGNVLERAGGVDIGRALIEPFAGLGLDALFAQQPGCFLDVLCRVEYVRSGLFRGVDDCIQLFRRRDELTFIVRCRDRRDFPAGLGDRLAHFDQFMTNPVILRLFLGLYECGF